MATHYNTRVVTDGLILYLDAANKKSYSGSGTTWTDLSGNGNSGTLTNGPTFNSDNNGSVVFDGSNDYVQGANLSLTITASFSISAICRFANVSSPGFQKILHVQTGTPEVNIDNYNGGAGNPKIHFYTAATSSSNNIMTAGEDAASNTWYHIVGVYDNSTFMKYLYVNSVLKNSGSTGVKISWPNSVLRVGYRLSNVEPFNGNISQVQVYNRALSAAEIQQNFNATRSRYGI